MNKEKGFTKTTAKILGRTVELGEINLSVAKQNYKIEMQPSFENDGYGHRRSVTSISEQGPLFEFEGFVIKEYDGWNMWIENPKGEGTTIPKLKFLNILDKIFKDNF